jgi:hypothetical protein
MKAQSNWKFIEPLNRTLPRVTYILKDVLAKGKAYDEYLMKKGTEAKNELTIAGSVGDGLHNLTKRIGLGETIDLNSLEPLQKTWIEQFIEWKEKNVKEFLLVENSVYNSTCGYCGTLDALILSKENKIVLPDYKSGNTLGLWQWKIQASAYANCDNVSKVDNGLILHFDKTSGKMTPIEINDLDYQFTIFEYTLKIFNHKHPKKEDLNGKSV